MYDHKAAERERIAADITKATRDEHGAWRWTSSGNCPFDDVLEVWEDRGLITAAARQATIAARQADTAAFMAAYRASQPAEPSDEERAEARAAHGPGVKLVDVITGRTYTT